MTINVYLGPMFSGKTTHLMSLFNYYGGIILDHTKDETRINKKDTFKSHNNIEMECYKVNKLKSFMTEVGTNERNIFINEAQFFDDLYEFVLEYENDKNIYIFGLDGDFNRKPFGQILNVIPLADYVKKFKGMCKICSNDSLFSKRIVPNTEQYLLDETAYIPTCRDCYNTRGTCGVTPACDSTK
jgi:thymidine kinase